MQPPFWHSENYESLGKWADGISRMQLQNEFKAGSSIDAKTTKSIAFRQHLKHITEISTCCITTVKIIYVSRRSAQERDFPRALY